MSAHCTCGTLSPERIDPRCRAARHWIGPAYVAEAVGRDVLAARLALAECDDCGMRHASPADCPAQHGDDAAPYCNDCGRTVSGDRLGSHGGDWRHLEAPAFGCFLIPDEPEPEAPARQRRGPSGLPADLVGEMADRALAQYGAIVSHNDATRAGLGESWDFCAAVATCRDGIWGAFGELIDIASMLYPEPWRDEVGDFARGDALEDALRVRFRLYQRQLALEIGPERLAAHVAQHGGTVPA